MTRKSLLFEGEVHQPRLFLFFHLGNRLRNNLSSPSQYKKNRRTSKIAAHMPALLSR